jgi:hypothetical protein
VVLEDEAVERLVTAAALLEDLEEIAAEVETGDETDELAFVVRLERVRDVVAVDQHAEVVLVAPGGLDPNERIAAADLIATGKDVDVDATPVVVVIGDGGDGNRRKGDDARASAGRRNFGIDSSSGSQRTAALYTAPKRARTTATLAPDRPPGPLAQLGERRLDKPEVTGSSPVRPTLGLAPAPLRRARRLQRSWCVGTRAPGICRAALLACYRPRPASPGKSSFSRRAPARRGASGPRG